MTDERVPAPADRTAHRVARPDELDAAYLMGLDAWGEGLAPDEYLRTCRASPKYAAGTWYMLVEGDAPVASLLLHRDGFGLVDGHVGIGSIATASAHRRRGLASMLVGGVVDDLRRGGTRAAWLFPDIDPAFYERLGFRRREPIGASRDEVCMVASLVPDAVRDAPTPGHF